jgi:hypothetical protein
MEGDRAGAAGGRLGVAGQAVGDQQVQTPALALGQTLVGDLAHHAVAEAPDVGAIAVAFEQLLLLEPAERLAGRVGDQVELGEVNVERANTGPYGSDLGPGEVVDPGRDHGLHGGAAARAVRPVSAGSRFPRAATSRSSR